MVGARRLEHCRRGWGVQTVHDRYSRVESRHFRPASVIARRGELDYVIADGSSVGLAGFCGIRRRGSGTFRNASAHFRGCYFLIRRRVSSEFWSNSVVVSRGSVPDESPFASGWHRDAFKLWV